MQCKCFCLLKTLFKSRCFPFVCFALKTSNTNNFSMDNICSITAMMSLSVVILITSIFCLGHSGKVSRKQDYQMISKTDDKIHLWPRATIPYKLSSNYSSYEQSVIRQAMATISIKSCVRFAEKFDSNVKDFIDIMPGADCRSSYGNTGGHQVVSLAHDCVYVQTVMHELMHTLGINHEHTRPDRDEYIKINWDNIEDRFKHNFFKRNNTVMLREFDFYSIMMYSKNDFAKVPGLVVIESLIPSQSIVERSEKPTLSKGDVINVNRLYSCGND